MTHCLILLYCPLHLTNPPPPSPSSRTIPTIDQLATSLAAVLAERQLPPVVLAAHSYGTLVAAALLRTAPAAVSRVALADPVCFAMFMPRLLHGFIYAPLTLRIDA